MKKSKKWLSLLVTLSLSVTLLAACGGGTESTTTGTQAPTDTDETGEEPTDTDSEPTDTEDPSETEDPGSDLDTPLVVGYADFSGKFSPFFAETAYDRDVVNMTQVGLLTTDRNGAIIFDAIEGETHAYAGQDYLYTGIADLAIDRTDTTTTYTFTLREGVHFSDGVELTADDIIFNLYAYLDTSYIGSSTVNSLAIQGLEEYRTQSSPEIAAKYAEIFDSIYAAGRDHEWSESDAWTQEQQTSVWELIDENWQASIDYLVDFVFNNYGSNSVSYMGIAFEDLRENEGLQVAYAAYLWGFADYGPEIAEGEETAADDAESFLTLGEQTYDINNGEYPTHEELYEHAVATYEGDDATYSDIETASGGTPVAAGAEEDFIATWGPLDEESEGGFDNISGIVKNDDYSVSVTLDGFDAAAVYRLGLTVAPLHYYGNPDLYDYENNQFGFERGDLLTVLREGDKATVPMGAGPYVFESYANNVVEYSASEHYWQGEPNIKVLQFREVSEADKTTGVATGVLDITDPSFNVNTAGAIQDLNSNGELAGDVITTVTVDNLGYGYIGINADTVRVGEDSASEESKNLRKGLATTFSVYRELATSTYYGETASVINYPISNTSWAAPQETDSDYEIAYSVDIEGNPIYTSEMTPDERYAAALDATVGYLIAAGYTFDEASGQFTAAPEGASLDYEIIVPAGGAGDHPAFQIISETSAAFATIGIDLVINDPADSNVLWNSLDAGSQELWAAAWGATIDPDMYQVYHSSNVVGEPNASESNHYHIRDAELDELIMDARSSEDQEFRKATYKAALDIILDWGVEIPTYQRLNAVIFSTERVNLDTVTPDITTYWGWTNDIHLIEMNAG